MSRRRTFTGLTAVQPDEAAYVARLERMDADDLARVAEWVEKLEEHPGWQALTELVDESHEDAFLRVLAGHRGANGDVLTQAEYARLHGFFAGLGEFRAAQKAFVTANQRRMERNEKAVSGL